MPSILNICAAGVDARLSRGALLVARSLGNALGKEKRETEK